MRFPDTLLQKNFMVNYYNTKSRLSDIQTRLTTQSKVNKPSDDPLSNSRILRMQNQLSSIDTYKSNISYAKSVMNDGIIAMEGIQEEVQNVQILLTQINSAIVNNDVESFADSIDVSLDIILELANTEFNGQYNFGGTESGEKPFYYDEASNSILTNNEHIGGDKVVKISTGITQKFSINGQELFQSVFKEVGNLDSTAGVGVSQTDSSKIYDAEGNEYTLNLDYKMTAANTYELDYSIVDSDSNVIETNTVSDIKFNADTGEFEEIGSDKFGEIHIQNSDNNIDFIIDVKSLTEKDTATDLRSSLNQKADIFNTLISIRETLKNGEKPTAEQQEMIGEFNQHILSVLSKAGGISNKLTSTEQILLNKETEVASLLSTEKDVDIAKTLLELESAQYTLDISYKISSMILPNSLLDYF